MDILLEPNFAYLLVVGAFLLTLMAFATPGTGILEIGALFTILLAGWACLNLQLNYYALGLLVLGIFPLTALFRTRRSIFLVLSILFLEVGSAFLFRGEGWQPAVNPLLAIVVSVGTAGLYWIAAHKIMEAEQARPTHDLSRLIGLAGETRTDLKTTGSIYLDGELWSARSDQPIPKGTPVRVIGREGLVLEVEQIQPPVP